jgi:hypothetical protein
MKNDSEESRQSGADSGSIRSRVQGACTSGFTGIARVTVTGDIGYWYFRRGDIVHATTLDLVGDDAALRMLSWEGCEWEPCARPWPSERSVFVSWVELFQRAGELPRAAPPLRAVAPSAPPPPPPPPAMVIAPSTLSGLTPRFFPGTSVPASAAPPRRPLTRAQLESLAGAAIDCWVLEGDGSSRTLHGESGVLSELASFAAQVCERIGSLLGTGRCLALEASYPGHTLLIANNGSNTVALTVAQDGELGWVKERLRL